MAFGGQMGVQQRHQVELTGDVEQGGHVAKGGDLGFQGLGRAVGLGGRGHQIVDLAEVDLAHNFGFTVDALAVAGVVIGFAVDDFRGEARHV